MNFTPSLLVVVNFLPVNSFPFEVTASEVWSSTSRSGPRWWTRDWRRTSTKISSTDRTWESAQSTERFISSRTEIVVGRFTQGKIEEDKQRFLESEITGIRLFNRILFSKSIAKNYCLLTMRGCYDWSDSWLKLFLELVE